MANVPGIVTPLVTTFLTSGPASDGFGWHAVFILAAMLNVASAFVWRFGATADPIPGL